MLHSVASIQVKPYKTLTRPLKSVPFKTVVLKFAFTCPHTWPLSWYPHGSDAQDMLTSS